LQASGYLEIQFDFHFERRCVVRRRLPSMSPILVNAVKNSVTKLKSLGKVTNKKSKNPVNNLSKRIFKY
jgi:hypothetical protein